MAGVLRTSTIVTADVVESTSLERAIGDKLYLALLGELRSIAQQVTEAVGGKFLSTEGDGLWAAFDASVDAVTAAVRLMQATLRLDESKQLPGDVQLMLRIGITTGDVTWTEGRTDCQGLARNLAKRLEADAASNTIVCSKVVPFLAGAANRHQFAPRGPRMFKGFDDPVETFEVKYPGPDEEPLPARLPAGLEDLDSDTSLSWKFVGRTDELESVASTWKRVVLGAGHVVAIAGEAGVGKSSLCLQAAQGVAEKNAVILHGRVDEQVTYPYEPFVDAIRDFIHRADANPTLLQTTLGPSASTLSLIIPELLDWPDVERPPPRDYRTQRHLLFDAVASCIRNIASVNPVILVLDDLTWADDQTLAMAQHLMRRNVDAAVMVMYTFRPAEVAEPIRAPFRAAHKEIERLRSFKLLELGGLSEDDVRALLQEGEAPTVDAHDITEHTGGNPFFLRELLREFKHDPSLLGGAFDRRSGLRAPHAVKDLIAKRARRLLDPTIELLAVAAVSGVTWAEGPVREILEVDHDVMIDALADAAGAELIRRTAPDRGPVGWGFTHAILRDAIYEQIPEERRRSLHRRTAQVLERRRVLLHQAAQGNESFVVDLTEPIPSPADLAYHYRAAGQDPDKVVEYCLLAAGAASARFAYEGAVDYYQIAHATLDELEERPWGLESGVLFGLGVAQRRAGQPVVVVSSGQEVDTLLSASAMAAEEGNGELCARAVLAGSRGMFTSTGETVHQRIEAIDRALELVTEPVPLRASLLATKAVELSFGNEYRQAAHGETDRRPQTDEAKRKSELARIDQMKALSQEAIDIATSIVGDDPEPAALGPLIEALSLRVVALWRPEDLTQRLEIARQLSEACQVFRRPQATLNAATVSAQVAMEVGDFDLADIHMETIEWSASELRQPTVLGYAFLRQSMRKSVDGEFDESERLAKLAYAHARDAGQPDARAFYMGQIFNLRYHQGRLDEIVDEFAEVTDIFQGIVAFRACKALVASELGDRDTVEQSLNMIYSEGGCGVPHDLNWMATTAFAAEAAAWLGDRDLCRRLIEELEPFRDLYVDNASTFFGSVERYLGLAYAAVGETDSARIAFDRAIDAHATRAPVLLARTQLEYAEMLLRPDASLEDRDKAAVLLDRCLVTAGLLELGTIERRANAKLPVPTA